MSRRPMLIAIVAFLLGAAVAALLFMNTGRGAAPDAAAARARADAGGRQLYYCPMHPSMVSDRPGDCPICQMRMVPVEEDLQAGQAPQAAAGGAGARAPEDGGAPVEGRAPVRISPQKQQLIGVRTAPVERRPLVRTLRTVGRVTYDETRLHHIHTKVGGWIERLLAGSTGELVRKGQPLLTLYSPELLASQEEYLLALRARDRLAGASVPSAGGSGEELVASARRRLRLYDLTEEQIAELERSGAASRTTTLYAPITGHIITREVKHGQKIDSGMPILDIADLSRVWVLADVYEYELPFVRQGQKATMTLSYLPGLGFEGRVGLIYPVLSEQTRTVKVRLEFPNPDLALKPEMFAEVTLHSDLGRRLVVPGGALISTGERDIVFVDRGEGYFEPRQVKVGVRLADAVEVIDGLAEGEMVITSGNFLIDSESKLKAALGAAGEARAPGAQTAPAGRTPPGHVH